MDNTLIPRGTVVAGIDGSPAALQALDWAIDQAVREHRQLTLAHGNDPHGFAEADDDDARVLLARTRAYVVEREPGLAVHETRWLADPRVTLRRMSEDAAYVVVGSRGLGPVRSRLLGSVGAAVVRDPACPVVVVRPHHPGAVRHGVVVPADGSPTSRATVELAYRQASLRDLPLTILHGEPERWAVEPLSGLAEKFPEVRGRLEATNGAAVDALVRSSERMDLVVVGSAAALPVVEHAACPVLVAPTGG